MPYFIPGQAGSFGVGTTAKIGHNIGARFARYGGMRNWDTHLNLYGQGTMAMRSHPEYGFPAARGQAVRYLTGTLDDLVAEATRRGVKGATKQSAQEAFEYVVGSARGGMTKGTTGFVPKLGPKALIDPTGRGFGYLSAKKEQLSYSLSMGEEIMSIMGGGQMGTAKIPRHGTMRTGYGKVRPMPKQVSTPRPQVKARPVQAAQQATATSRSTARTATAGGNVGAGKPVVQPTAPTKIRANAPVNPTPPAISPRARTAQRTRPTIAQGKAMRSPRPAAPQTSPQRQLPPPPPGYPAQASQLSDIAPIRRAPDYPRAELLPGVKPRLDDPLTAGGIVPKLQPSEAAGEQAQQALSARTKDWMTRTRGPVAPAAETATEAATEAATETAKRVRKPAGRANQVPWMGTAGTWMQRAGLAYGAYGLINEREGDEVSKLMMGAGMFIAGGALRKQGMRGGGFLKKVMGAADETAAAVPAAAGAV